MATNVPSMPNGVVTSNRPNLKRSIFSHGKRPVIIVISICIVVLAVALIIWALQRDDNFPKDPGSTISDNALLGDEVAGRLRAKTGLNMEDLKSRPIDSKTFKDFTQAFTAAGLLERASLHKQAVAAYAAAETKGSDANLSIDFYEAYMDSADNANMLDLADKIAVKYKKVIEGDSSLGSFERQRLLERLQMVNHDRQEYRSGQ